LDTNPTPPNSWRKNQGLAGLFYINTSFLQSITYLNIFAMREFGNNTADIIMFVSKTIFI